MAPIVLDSGKQVLDRPHPCKLFLEVTTRCNLQCRMCVKQSSDSGILPGDLAVSTFERLKPEFPYLDEVIISGVGEPLLHSRLEAFILDMKAMLPASGLVGLQTNGKLLNRSRIESLLSVDLDTICISVDTINQDRLSTIGGVPIEQLETALGLLNRAKNRSCSAPLLGVQFTLLRDNMHDLPQVLRWAGRMGADFAIVSYLLPFDAGWSRQAAYPVGSDAAMELFFEWREKISSAGLRIEDYPVALMKFHKCRTADEAKLIQMVETMKSEGCRNEIFIDLRRLLALQSDWSSRVEAVFDEAMRVAQSMGMDLILPSLQPSHARRCSFVEEGAVFVAWDGSVSPCHFAWHPYACFPEGRKKTVQTLCFGNLESLPLGDIWNRAEFQSFRKSVLLYKFPYCGDCGLCPCDYIDGPESEQDCHTNTTPCCDCPWSTGILNCLQ